MKKLSIYNLRKSILGALLIFYFLFTVVYIVMKGWEEPNILLIISYLLNIVALMYIFRNSYRNTFIKLYKDKVVYRLSGMIEEKEISINEETNISKDWKGVNFKNGENINSISSNYMWDREFDKLYREIKEYYGSPVS